MLSNLGAISEDKAADRQLLGNSWQLKGMEIDGEISKLIESGYVKEASGKLYLTKAGLFRALSKFS
jgi:hypothetical protein